MGALKGSDCMKKDAVEDKADNKAGEPVSTGVVFKSDANVLEYLNSLLSSVPAVVLESGETQFVRLAIDEGWKGLDAATALISNAISYHNDLSKKEVEQLEFENRNLKFREELASIDAQVVRSENEKLKEQIAWLTENLDTVKAALQELTAENDGLKARARFFEEQLAVLKNIKTAADPPSDGPESVAEEGSGSETMSGLDHRSPSAEDPVEMRDNEIVEDVQENCAVTVFAEQEGIAANESCSSVEPERGYVSQPGSGNAKVDIKAFPNALILSRGRDLSGAAIRGGGSATKIIKQQTADLSLSPVSHEPVRPVEKPFKSVTTIGEVVCKPEPVTPEEPDGVKPGENGPVSGDPDLHTQEDTNPDMEPVPETSDVLRRKVKNYENLQSDADSANNRTRHTLIL